MWGIVGYTGQKGAQPVLLKALCRLEYGGFRPVSHMNGKTLILHNKLPLPSVPAMNRRSKLLVSAFLVRQNQSLPFMNDYQYPGAGTGSYFVNYSLHFII